MKQCSVKVNTSSTVFLSHWLVLLPADGCFTWTSQWRTTWTENSFGSAFCRGVSRGAHWSQYKLDFRYTADSVERHLDTLLKSCILFYLVQFLKNIFIWSMITCFILLVISCCSLQYISVLPVITAVVPELPLGINKAQSYLNRYLLLLWQICCWNFSPLSKVLNLLSFLLNI